jgi:hypothetical protein
MKKVIGMMVGALVCSLAATAFAAESSERPLRVAASNENLAFVYATDGAWDGGVCNNNGIIYIDISTEGGRAMYQTALAAYLAGKVILATYDVCSEAISTNPKRGFPMARRIDIVD